MCPHTRPSARSEVSRGHRSKLGAHRLCRAADENTPKVRARLPLRTCGRGRQGPAGPGTWGEALAGSRGQRAREALVQVRACGGSRSEPEAVLDLFIPENGINLEAESFPLLPSKPQFKPSKFKSGWAQKFEENDPRFLCRSLLQVPVGQHQSTVIAACGRGTLEMPGPLQATWCLYSTGGGPNPPPPTTPRTLVLSCPNSSGVLLYELARSELVSPGALQVSSGCPRVAGAPLWDVHSTPWPLPTHR